MSLQPSVRRSSFFTVANLFVIFVPCLFFWMKQAYSQTPVADFTYDGNGNMTSKTEDGVTTTYTWDSQDKLVEAERPAGDSGTALVVEYRYDPFRRRIQKSVNDKITTYVYDREDIVAEYDGAGVLQASYVHGPGIDESLQMKRGGVTYFYQRDGLGSIVSLSKADGIVVKRYRYGSFGNIIEETGIELEQPYRFAGMIYDSETGLYYARMRYYDP
jgi:YD repeat-containing protein